LERITNLAECAVNCPSGRNRFIVRLNHWVGGQVIEMLKLLLEDKADSLMNPMAG